MGCTHSRDINLFLHQNSDSTSKSFNIKTLILGEMEVGKTSIANKFCRNRFNDTYEVTIGASYMQKHLFLSSSTEFIYHLWDCCGNQRFQPLLPIFCKDAKIVIFVYDISREETFLKLEYWMSVLFEFLDKESLLLGLVGNKTDLCEGSREVTYERGRKFSREKRCFFSEISAKTGAGVVNFFLGLAENALKFV